MAVVTTTQRSDQKGVSESPSIRCCYRPQLPSVTTAGILATTIHMIVKPIVFEMECGRKFRFPSALCRWLGTKNLAGPPGDTLYVRKHVIGVCPPIDGSCCKRMTTVHRKSYDFEVPSRHKFLLLLQPTIIRSTKRRRTDDEEQPGPAAEQFKNRAHRLVYGANVSCYRPTGTTVEELLEATSLVNATGVPDGPAESSQSRETPWNQYHCSGTLAALCQALTRTGQPCTTT